MYHRRRESFLCISGVIMIYDALHLRVGLASILASCTARRRRVVELSKLWGFLHAFGLKRHTELDSRPCVVPSVVPARPQDGAGFGSGRTGAESVDHVGEGSRERERIG